MTHDEMIAVIQAHKNGTQIQYRRLTHGYGNFEDVINNNPSWVFDTYEYRAKPELTIQEITSQWVKDNDLKVGDHVRVKEDKPFIVKGEIYKVNVIGSYYIGCEDFAGEKDFSVEDIEKATKKVIPFIFEDMKLFMGKWIKSKGTGQVFMITAIVEHGIVDPYCNTNSFKSHFEYSEFVDGSPFGKEVWE